MGSGAEGPWIPLIVWPWKNSHICCHKYPEPEAPVLFSETGAAGSLPLSLPPSCPPAPLGTHCKARNCIVLTKGAHCPTSGTRIVDGLDVTSVGGIVLGT